MSLFARLRTHLGSFPPTALPLLLGAVLIAVLLGALSTTLGLMGLILVMIMVLIYADPPRAIPDHHGLTCAACDGIITTVKDSQGLPLSFDQAKDQTEHFMTITVEQNLLSPRHLRAPCDAQIIEILDHTPRPDGDDSAILQGDETAILFRDDKGDETALVIRGFYIPHQIRLTITPGTRVSTGDRIGIVFGLGAVDHYIKGDAARLVTIGSTAQAGETVLTGAYANAKHRTFKTI